MTRKFEECERDFIYLAYPLSLNKDIANVLNCSVITLNKYLRLFNWKKREKVNVGDIFKRLSVLDKSFIKRRNQYWKCQCICGKICHIKGSALYCGRTASCGCAKRKNVGYISGRFFSLLRCGAMARNLEFDLDMNFLNEMLIKQDFKCLLSGLPIEIALEAKTKNTASVDRIDSNVGYIKTNVQFVHKDINYMKWVLSNEDFIKFCSKIARKFS